MDAKKIGACIKRNRESHKMTLSDLSRMTGIPVSVLQSYENGTGEQRIEELKRISKAVQVPLLPLVHGGGEWESLGVDREGRRFCKRDKY